MADPKTKPTQVSVESFLNAVTPESRRRHGFELDQIFRDVTRAEPVMWGPSIIGYGSYRYTPAASPGKATDWPKVAFSPRKAKISLYGLKDQPGAEELLPRLGKYTEGKGCVYINKPADVDTAVLRELIALAWSRPDETGDYSC
ncbi:DUF1801 domain-containing protein [Actinomycetaceae bacterium L2_0104]